MYILFQGRYSSDQIKAVLGLFKKLGDVLVSCINLVEWINLSSCCMGDGNAKIRPGNAEIESK